MAINTLFKNIADAIRAKTGSAGTYTPAQMPGAISGINTGAVHYDYGAYFGISSGSNVSSMNIETNGHINKKAILVIMHRDNITLDASWHLVYKYDNPHDATRPITQFLSVYEKIINSSQEQYTIYQASTARMCACLFYTDADTNIIYNDALSMENSATYKYIVPFNDSVLLCCMSNPYAGEAIQTINPNILINESSDLTRRMVSFICASTSNTIYELNTAASVDDLFYNRMVLFTLSK